MAARELSQYLENRNSKRKKAAFKIWSNNVLSLDECPACTDEADIAMSMITIPSAPIVQPRTEEKQTVGLRAPYISLMSNRMCR